MYNDNIALLFINSYLKKIRSLTLQTSINRIPELSITTITGTVFVFVILFSSHAGPRHFSLEL